MDDIFDEIASELEMSQEEFEDALNKSSADSDTIERVYLSDVYTLKEALSIISDLLKLQDIEN